MKFKTKNKQRFLNSLGVFFVTVCVCVVIFIAVGITVLICTGNKQKTETFTAEQVANNGAAPETVVAVVKNKGKIYINKISFDFYNQTVNCSFVKNKTVYSLGQSKTLSEYYFGGGKSALVLALKEYLNQDFKYLEISEQQLKNLANIYGGVVVNNNTSRLMGLQISDFIKNNETANMVVKGLINSYFSNTNGKGIRNNYLALLENSNTELGYIDFYNHWEQIKLMKGG